jgi:nucleoside diphosphate kinase
MINVIIRPTNLEKAKATRPDSLRSLFGIDGTRNACHGSDAVTSAQKEIAFFFNIGGPPDRSLLYIS